MNLFVVGSENHKAKTPTHLAFLFLKWMKAGQNSLDGGENQQKIFPIYFLCEEILSQALTLPGCKKISGSYSIFETGK